jgi:signal transduction histidine kinase
MFRVLHLEARQEDASSVQQILVDNNVPATITHVKDQPGFKAALEKESFDLILADNAMPGFSGLEALELARKRSPEIPIIFVSSAADSRSAQASLVSGATDYIFKDHLWQLPPAILRLQEKIQLLRTNRRRARLMTAVQELSLARDLPAIMDVVRHAARELTNADGTTFVLRDGNLCYYADEDAVGPLWKGQRFPMSACISGWVMLNRQSAFIEDIYADPRIPADAYRPTFVKSLAMVPIRTESPIGAIGNYWAQRHLPTAEETELLQALANTTAVAIENVQVYNELEQRVSSRTAQLEAANRELEAFSYAVSHDLNAPLRSINSYSSLLLKECSQKLDEEGNLWARRIRAASEKMGDLIDDLLRLSTVTRSDLKIEKINLSELVQEILSKFASTAPDRKVELNIACGLEVAGDLGLMQVALENLLSNAWKYTSKTAQPRIEVGAFTDANKSCIYYVRDNGAGFHMRHADKLFQPFQRLHHTDEFPGTGIGLITIQRIIQRHGGRIWAEAVPGQGATFYFTLNDDSATNPSSLPVK